MFEKITFESLTELKCIGQGQFGQVFKAKHKELRIPVAVKKLKGNVSQRFEELLQEAEKLQHASKNFYVTTLIGIITTPPCIVMELMEYGSLGTLMETVETIMWPFKYRILYEVALGMNWLHSLSLLHLDLKPKNVLLNDGLHIRIADFGLSKYTSAVVDGGDNEDIGGTLEYMPPEAFQEGYKPSESTDIYSFAILSAVVLRGEDPYPVRNSAMISLHVPRGERPSFTLLENIDDVKNLDKAIKLSKQCWDSDMDQRPAFSECCTQWEMIKSGYEEKEIRDAVRAAQNIMDHTDSSGSTTDVPQTASSETANTKDMSEMIKQLEITYISEHPSVKQKAVPIMNPNRGYSRSPVTNSSQINQQSRVWHPRHYPASNRTDPGHAWNHPINPNQFSGRPTGHIQQSRQMRQAPTYGMGMPDSTTGYHYQKPQSYPHYGNTMQPPFLSSPANITVSGNTTSLQVGNNNTMIVMGTTRPRGPIPQTGFRPPHRPSFGGYASQPQSFNITLDGSTDGLQIGDHNEMVVSGSSQHTDSSTNPFTPHYGQTVHTSPPSTVRGAPASSTSQVHLSTKARDAYPGDTQAINETTRQNDHPDQPSLAQAANMRSPLQKQTTNNLSDSKTEHDSYRKPIPEAQHT